MVKKVTLWWHGSKLTSMSGSRKPNVKTNDRLQMCIGRGWRISSLRAFAVSSTQMWSMGRWALCKKRTKGRWMRTSPAGGYLVSIVCHWVCVCLSLGVYLSLGCVGCSLAIAMPVTILSLLYHCLWPFSTSCHTLLCIVTLLHRCPVTPFPKQTSHHLFSGKLDLSFKFTILLDTASVAWFVCFHVFEPPHTSAFSFGLLIMYWQCWFQAVTGHLCLFVLMFSSNHRFFFFVLVVLMFLSTHLTPLLVPKASSAQPNSISLDPWQGIIDITVLSYWLFVTHDKL